MDGLAQTCGAFELSRLGCEKDRAEIQAGSGAGPEELSRDQIPPVARRSEGESQLRPAEQGGAQESQKSAISRIDLLDCKKLLDHQANKSASTLPERTRADRTPVGRWGKSGRPRGEASASACIPARPHLPGDPEEEDEGEEEEEEADPDFEELASPRALSFSEGRATVSRQNWSNKS